MNQLWEGVDAAWRRLRPLPDSHRRDAGVTRRRQHEAAQALLSRLGGDEFAVLLYDKAVDGRIGDGDGGGAGGRADRHCPGGRP